MCKGFDKLASWYIAWKSKPHNIYANVHDLRFAAMRIGHRDHRLGPCSAVTKHFVCIR